MKSNYFSQEELGDIPFIIYFVAGHKMCHFTTAINHYKNRIKAPLGSG